MVTTTRYSVIYQKFPSRVRVAQKIPSSIRVAGTRWGLLMSDYMHGVESEMEKSNELARAMKIFVPSSTFFSFGKKD